MIKRTFAVRSPSIPADLALLLLRIVMGSAFIIHGWPKIQHPLDWMPPGFAPPPLLALAAVSEFVGGIMLILGILTPIAAIGILCTMGTAFYMHTVVRGDPFVANELRPTSELAAVFFAVALVLLMIGPGRLSLDRYAFGRK